MKRICSPKLLALFLLSGLALVSAGCPMGSPSDPSSDAVEPELVIRFACLANASHRVWVAVDLVRTELQQRSQGRIKVVLYDAGVLGAERQLLEACFFGIVDMVQCTSAVVTSTDPVFSLLDLPYVFVDEAHHQRVLHGPIGQALLDGLRDHHLQGLTFYSCGFRNIFNSKNLEIKTPEDLNGLKIRVMESPVMVRSLNALGASATPLSAGEVFQSLKTHVVDGAENDPETFVSDKYYEAGCRNYSLTQHFANQHVLVVNRDWFDALKVSHPDLHDLIREIPALVVPLFNQKWQEGITLAMQEMEEVGVKVNEVENVQTFIDKVQPVYEDFFTDHPEVSRDWIERIGQEAQQ